MYKLQSLVRPIPYEVILMILEAALPAPGPSPPNAVDRQSPTNLLLLNRPVYRILMRRFYKTVVLWSLDSIDRFVDTMKSFPHLGSLVINLWIGNQDIERDQLSGTSQKLGPILVRTRNIQRLYIAYDVNGRECLLKSAGWLPKSLRHLTLPNAWLMATLKYGERYPHPHPAPKLPLPPALESLRVRGLLHPRALVALFLLNRDVSRAGQDSSPPARMIYEVAECSHVVGFASWGKLVHSAAVRDMDLVVPPGLTKDWSHEFTSRKQVLPKHGVRISEQPLDDAGQLGAWLSECESA
ncbi:hypothetical protein FRC07_010812 [Ceratobasidium sp. 392]|nr:hypothetical protein FRC07_010812 [Ceratobasidium sp. 392]